MLIKDLMNKEKTEINKIFEDKFQRENLGKIIIRNTEIHQNFYKIIYKD